MHVNGNISMMDERIALHHTHNVSPNQCTSYLVQKINAPLPLVWSIIRRFDCPQVYKALVKSCNVVNGSGGRGSIREVRVVSGLPAETSVERLDFLDDESHVMKFSIIGGDHRLKNYQATTTLHEEYGENGGNITVVIESYVVDLPAGNTIEETCCFIGTVVGSNLKSLATVSERLASFGEI